jgi:hypothetical protein
MTSYATRGYPSTHLPDYKEKPRRGEPGRGVAVKVFRFSLVADDEP